MALWARLIGMMACSVYAVHSFACETSMIPTGLDNFAWPKELSYVRRAAVRSQEDAANAYEVAYMAAQTQHANIIKELQNALLDCLGDALEQLCALCEERPLRAIASHL
eukprot:1153119-Pelagomonas_calceolata.AAC.8